MERYQFDQPDLCIALISDTHGHLDANVAELIRGCDIAIHAGDVMDAAVLEQMQPKLQQTIAVAGNNDVRGLWSSQEQRYVGQLSDAAQLELPGGCIVVEHGHRFGFSQPDHSALRNAHPEARLIIYGHTHKQLVEMDNTPWLVNPGAAGLVRNQGGPRCLLLETNGRDWQISPRIFPQPVLKRSA